MIANLFNGYTFLSDALFNKHADFYRTLTAKAEDVQNYAGDANQIRTNFANGLAAPTSLNIDTPTFQSSSGDKVVYTFKGSWGKPKSDQNIYIQMNNFIGNTTKYKCHFDKWVAGYINNDNTSQNVMVDYYFGGTSNADNNRPFPMQGTEITPITTSGYNGGSFSTNITFTKKTEQEKVAFWVVSSYACANDNVFTGNNPNNTHFISNISTTIQFAPNGNSNTQSQLGSTSFEPTILKPNQSDITYDETNKQFTIPISWNEPQVINTGSASDKTDTMSISGRRSYYLSDPQYNILSMGSNSGVPIATVNQPNPENNKINHTITIKMQKTDPKITKIYAIEANYKDKTSYTTRYSQEKSITLGFDASTGQPNVTVTDLQQKPTTSQTTQEQSTASGKVSNGDACGCQKGGADISEWISFAMCTSICTVSQMLGQLACFFADNIIDPIWTNSYSQTCSGTSSSTTNNSTTPTPALTDSNGTIQYNTAPIPADVNPPAA